ncbi:MAG: transcriptional regulator, LuxR family [Ilumatobacteraceae bacterium]|nr:transcriptional regulator, LuxR family [Ilumatobacteraceae bacterium]
MSDWPLIGRERELGVIAEVLGRPDASGVVLAGAAGVGKTRLATEAMRLGDRSGFATARVVASRAASAIPFGALAPLLPSGVTAMAQGLNALRQATMALAERAAGDPLMLLVDDAHALDDASAVLLQQLAATKAAFLVVTVRTGEQPPEGVTALWKDHDVERLTIEPLSRETSEKFVMGMLGGEVDFVTLSMLWSKTQGNALFLRELVLGAVEDGSLTYLGGRWQSDGEVEPSDRLTELVGSRLSGLDRAELDVLELVAFGEPLSVGMLSDLSDPEVIEQLERKGLLMLVHDRRRQEVRLSHPMYGEVLRLRTPGLRVRSISRVLAEALEATGSRRRGDALRTSMLRLDGGGLPSMPLLLEGTAQAMFAHDYSTALRLARTAFACEESYDSGMMLLTVLYDCDGAHECEAVFRAVDPYVVTDPQLTRFALSQATTRFWKLYDAAGAADVLVDALQRLESQDEKDEVSSFLAVMEVQSGKSREALERTAGVLAGEDGRPYLLVSLCAAIAMSIVGRSQDGVDVADRALAIPLEGERGLTVGQRALLTTHKAAALNETGRIKEAYEIAMRVRRMTAVSNDLANQGFVDIALARICLHAGRLREAAQLASEALEMFRRWGHYGPTRWALGYVALASAMTGEIATAVDAISELDVLPVHPARMLDVDMMRARAWTAAAQARPEQAREILRELADEMRDTGQRGFEILVLFDLARLGEPDEVASRLAEIVEPGQSILHEAMASAAAAMARSNPAELVAQADAFAEMGANLFAAECAVAAADAYRRDGDQRRGVEWSRRAADLSALCPGARTPGLMQIQAMTPLTQREREIASLAAQGLPSKTIGERLYVTSRTVDNHLARIYSKLGVGSRAELAETLVGIE